MIGIICGFAIVAAVAAIVIADASPRPISDERSILVPWDQLLAESGNGMQAPHDLADGFAEDGSTWSERSSLLPGDGGPSGGLGPPLSSVGAAIVPRAGSVDLVPLGGMIPVGVSQLRPDPERLIQTEVAVSDDSSVRLLALARLVLGLVGFAAVVAFMMIGFARGLGFLVKKLAGG